MVIIEKLSNILLVRLKLSEKTISNHKTNILKKLELKSDADLIKYAIKNGIISLE